MKKLKLAIVHDDFIQNGGAEYLIFEFVKELLKKEMYEITIFSSIISKEWEKKFIEVGVVLKPSFLSSIPFSDKISKFYFLTNLFYLAFESFDFSDYRVVFSSSTRFGHSIITSPNTFHISYLNSPSKMLWEIQKYYIGKKMLYQLVKNFLPNKRILDYITQQRADTVISNSYNISRKVKKLYNRDSLVIYPFVKTENYINNFEKKDYYLLISRLIPWKRIDYVINVFNSLPDRKLIIVGKGDSKYINKLKSLSKSNIEFIGYISKEEKIKKIIEAKGLIVPQDEDFGLIIPEALSLGTPVIYFNKGGAKEILSSGYGQAFENQTADSLSRAILKFETNKFDSTKLIELGNQFSVSNFTNQITKLIETKM